MIAHFSCGATSAIATALALKEDPDTEIIYADTRSEHEDNRRFLYECEEKLFKKKVKILHSDKFEDIFDVFKQRRFLSSPKGAPCTTELKKIPIRDYLGARLYEEPQVFGYDLEDESKGRIVKFREKNPLVDLRTPLIDRHLDKSDCLSLIDEYGIEVPEMYKLGYSHANCVGCVKAENTRYWAAIREDFPDTFKWYADFERTIGKKVDGKPIGAAINKTEIGGKREKLFLDELPWNIKPSRTLDISCSFSCGDARSELQ